MMRGVNFRKCSVTDPAIDPATNPPHPLWSDYLFIFLRVKRQALLKRLTGKKRLRTGFDIHCRIRYLIITLFGFLS